MPTRLGIAGSLIVFLGLCFQNAAHAISLGEKTSSVNLMHEAEVFVDESQKLTYQDAVVALGGGLFKKVAAQAANYGFQTHAYWFHVTIDHNLSIPREWMLAIDYAPLDYVDVYLVPEGEPPPQPLLSGDMRPFVDRTIKHRNHHFLLFLEKGKRYELFVRVQTAGAVEVPMLIQSLQTYAKFDHEIQFFQGLFVGFMLIMSSYYCLMGFGTRNREFLILGFSLLSLVGFKASISGLPTEYLWGDSVWFTGISTFLLTALAYFMTSLYTYTFLELDQYRFLKRLFQCFLIFTDLAAIGSLFIPYKYFKILTILGTIISLSIAVAGVYCYLKGFSPAKYFMISWIAVGLATLVFGLQKLGLVPVNFVTLYCVEVSLAFQALTLAMGQTAKIQEINKKTLAMRADALEAQKEANRVASEMNNKLEGLVEERTKDLWNKTHEIRVVLDSINQGICSIDTDFMLNANHSGYLNQILGCQDIAGQSLFEILFQKSDLDEDQRSQLRSAVLSVIDEDSIVFSMNADRFPSSITATISGQKRLLELDWAPLENQESVTTRLLVSIRDITDLHAAKEEAARKQDELLKIAAIIKIDASKFEGYVQACRASITKCQMLLAGPMTAENWGELLRNVHTIKGNSRIHGFMEIASLVHHIEDTLLVSSGAKFDDQIKGHSLEALASLRSCLDTYDTISRDILGRTGITQIEKTLTMATELLQELDNKGGLRGKVPAQRVQKVFEEFDLLVKEKFCNVIEPIRSSLGPLARQLGKPRPEIIVSGDSFTMSRDAAEKIQSIFVHLVRNSLDHGMRSSIPGKIFMDVAILESRVQVTYSDSGMGLNLDAISASAQRQGISFDPDNRQELAHLIFATGVTSAENITEISGRGVGMGAVKALVEELGGDIAVQLKDASLSELQRFVFKVTFSRACLDKGLNSTAEQERLAV